MKYDEPLVFWHVIKMESQNGAIVGNAGVSVDLPPRFHEIYTFDRFHLYR